MDRYVFDIYLNAKENMTNTEADWTKVYNCFRNALNRSGNDPDVNDSVQRCILALEAKFRDDWQYTDIGFNES